MCFCNDLKNSNISIKTEVMKKICKYHKTAGQEFSINQLVPKGMCFEAFSAAYPSALAMLYSADNNISFCRNMQDQPANSNKETTIQCPSQKNKVLFKIERKEKLHPVIKKMKNIFENAFKKIFFPIDKTQIEYDISMRVTNVEGQCPQAHKIGDEFFFNTKDTNILCPASFNSIYAFILMLHKNIPLPWAKDNNNLIHCPDHEGIIYKIEKTGEND